MEDLEIDYQEHRLTANEDDSSETDPMTKDYMGRRIRVTLFLVY